MKFLNNFLNGFGKALDLYPDTSNDRQALSKDWENIGNDLRKSMGRYDRKIEKEKEKEDEEIISSNTKNKN